MRPLLTFVLLGGVLVGCGETATISSGVAVSSAVVAEQAEPVEVTAAEGASSSARSVDLTKGPSLVLHASQNVTIEARSAPSHDAPVIASFQSRLGGPQAFLATMPYAEYEVMQSGGDPDWIEVLLPARPNGQIGWIPMDGLTAYRNRYRIDIDTSDFRLQVYDDDQMIVETVVALGDGATPTPFGLFYTTELIASKNPTGVYGPFAFGLSGYSDTLETFGSGDGLIGIHGTNQPEALGTYASHGCIRVPNDVISELAGTLPLGTPVQIHG